MYGLHHMPATVSTSMITMRTYEARTSSALSYTTGWYRTGDGRGINAQRLCTYRVDNALPLGKDSVYLRTSHAWFRVTCIGSPYIRLTSNDSHEISASDAMSTLALPDWSLELPSEVANNERTKNTGKSLLRQSLLILFIMRTMKVQLASGKSFMSALNASCSILHAQSH